MASLFDNATFSKAHNAIRGAEPKLAKLLAADIREKTNLKGPDPVILADEIARRVIANKITSTPKNSPLALSSAGYVNGLFLDAEELMAKLDATDGLEKILADYWDTQERLKHDF